MLDVDDVNDILSAGTDLLVVGTGYAENMRVEKGLQSRIEKENITLIAQDTHTAVKTFNRLRGESSGEGVLRCRLTVRIQSMRRLTKLRVPSTPT